MQCAQCEVDTPWPDLRGARGQQACPTKGKQGEACSKNSLKFLETWFLHPSFPFILRTGEIITQELKWNFSGKQKETRPDQLSFPPSLSGWLLLFREWDGSQVDRLLSPNASAFPYPVPAESVNNHLEKKKSKDASHAHTKEDRTTNRKKNPRKTGKPLSHPSPNFPFQATVRGSSVCLGCFRRGLWALSSPALGLE